ncbi:hypothetical protein BJF78_14295 [Pseudonocardia sp. CNS-139]|nr:hypothetical protein BJF78_14295 [Pseudonocardia sp. CNS-139]
MSGSARRRMVLVGGTGTIGSAVHALARDAYDVVVVARRGGDVQADTRSPESVAALFAQVGPFDDLVCTAGPAVLGALGALTEQDFADSFRNKVLAQVNLVRLGLGRVRPGGSFTLSSGYLDKSPIPGVAAVAMANGALDAFCRAAALEMPAGVRLNCVSPVFVEESLAGVTGVDVPAEARQSAADTARAYLAAVEGTFTGESLDPRAVTWGAGR